MRPCKNIQGIYVVRCNKGFSLIELLIVMVIFIIVILVSTQAFERIISNAPQQAKTSDSMVQGIVGLEIMRSDLEHAGYGLPWALDFTANFSESQVTANYLAPGIDPASFNDTYNTSVDANKVPRPVQSATASGVQIWENGRDYLVIKSTYIGLNTAAKKWSYVNYDATPYIRTGGTSEDFAPGDRVITLNAVDRKLIGVDTTHFSYKLPALSSDGKIVADPAYSPPSEGDNYLVYGVNAASDLTFPYNRVDYYIKRPSNDKNISSRCAPSTGILYKAHLNHSGGGVTQYPLLDCVADMQVSYGMDTNGDGAVDFHGDESALTSLSAKEIRDQLKDIRVDVLTHEGQKDKSYSYPNSQISVGGSAGRVYDVSTLSGIGSEWKNYRWKVYTLVVVPKNINY